MTYFIPLFTNIKDKRLQYSILERKHIDARILLGTACIYISTTTEKNCRLLRKEVSSETVVSQWKETWLLHAVYAMLLTDGIFSI